MGLNNKYQLIHYENKEWRCIISVYGMYSLEEARKEKNKIINETSDRVEIVRVIEEGLDMSMFKEGDEITLHFKSGVIKHTDLIKKYEKHIEITYNSGKVKKIKLDRILDIKNRFAHVG